MDLLSINLARSIRLFPTIDLNPGGKAIDRDAIKGVSQRYAFAKVPEPKDVVEARQKNQGIVFSNGLFKTTAGKTAMITLTTYADGLVVDTRSSTSDADEFLDDLFRWLHTELELPDPKTIRMKCLYYSDLFISMSRSLNIINPKFAAFSQMLTSMTKSPQAPLNFEVGALGFWIDPAHKAQQTNFRLERAQGVPFSENRYYSAAPLETEDHLKALSELERLITT